MKKLKNFVDEYGTSILVGLAIGGTASAFILANKYNVLYAVKEDYRNATNLLGNTLVQHSDFTLDDVTDLLKNVSPDFRRVQ